MACARVRAGTQCARACARARARAAPRIARAAHSTPPASTTAPPLRVARRHALRVGAPHCGLLARRQVRGAAPCGARAPAGWLPCALWAPPLDRRWLLWRGPPVPQPVCVAELRPCRCMRSQPLPCEGQPAAHKLASRAEAPPRPPVTSALCAKRRRRAAPGRRGWIISEGPTASTGAASSWASASKRTQVDVWVRRPSLRLEGAPGRMDRGRCTQVGACTVRNPNPAPQPPRFAPAALRARIVPPRRPSPA